MDLPQEGLYQCVCFVFRRFYVVLICVPVYPTRFEQDNTEYRPVHRILFLSVKDQVGLCISADTPDMSLLLPNFYTSSFAGPGCISMGVY